LDAPILLHAGLATLLLVSVLFLAAVLLRRWRQDALRPERDAGERVTLETLLAEFATRGAPAPEPGPHPATAAAGPAAEERAVREQLADAEGLLRRMRRDEAQGPQREDRARAIEEGEREVAAIRVALRRGEVGPALDRARALTLRLARLVARWAAPDPDAT
jgi:hypothetical protein